MLLDRRSHRLRERLGARAGVDGGVRHRRRCDLRVLTRSASTCEATAPRADPRSKGLRRRSAVEEEARLAADLGELSAARRRRRRRPAPPAPPARQPAAPADCRRCASAARSAAPSCKGAGRSWLSIATRSPACRALVHDPVATDQAAGFHRGRFAWFDASSTRRSGPGRLHHALRHHEGSRSQISTRAFRYWPEAAPGRFGEFGAQCTVRASVDRRHGEFSPSGTSWRLRRAESA